MKFKNLTEEQKLEIKSRYIDWESTYDIAPDFGVHRATIGVWLGNIGVKTRPGGQSQPDNNRIEEWIARYNSGESMYSIGRTSPFCITTIRKYLLKSGIHLRDKLSVLRKYEVNEVFFDHINNESKSYWLGFIFADGYCRRELIIQLASQDEDHLYSLQKSLGSTHPITIVQKDQRRLCINHKHLTQILRKFPITPKSKIKFPLLPQRLQPHFIRGYVDGDGGFYFYPPYGFHFIVTTKNKTFMEQMGNIISQRSGANSKSPKLTSHQSYELRWGGRMQVTKIFNFLYSSATIWLPRKRQAVESHLN